MSSEEFIQNLIERGWAATGKEGGATVSIVTNPPDVLIIHFWEYDNQLYCIHTEIKQYVEQGKRSIILNDINTYEKVMQLYELLSGGE